MISTPKSEIDARLQRLQRQISSVQLDGALIHGVTNLFYFTGTAQQAHLWVPSSGAPILLVRRVIERARAESPLTAVEEMMSLKKLPDHLGSARRIGMELDIMPVSLFRRYQSVMPAVEAVDIGPDTRMIRSVKSAHEIDCVRAAAAASDAAFKEIRAGLHEGMSELELAIIAEGAERRHGFQGVLRWRAPAGFECPWVHILAGESALDFSFPDTPFGGQGVTPAAPYGAGLRTIRRNEPVCVDFALARDGYIHDMTRTLSVGPLADDLVRAHEVCRAITGEFAREARPGVTGAALWDHAAEIAAEAGLADNFMGFGRQKVRFVGHGVGLELDELPVLAPRQQQQLEAGNVIAVEPKFFFPGVGAVGVENTYAIHEDTVEMLTLTAEDLVVVPCVANPHVGH